MSKSAYEKRTPESIDLQVRREIASMLGRKTSAIKPGTKLGALDGDGVFDLAHSLGDVFNIDVAEEKVESWNCVAHVIRDVADAPLRVRTVQMTRAPKATGKMKFPGVEKATTLDVDTLAEEIADRAAERMKSTRAFTFSHTENELQMRDPNTDDIFAVVTIVVSAQQVGFTVTHFPQPEEHTWNISVPFASWSLGSPYTLCRRFDMAAQLYVKDRPSDLREWLIETIANRVQFLQTVAPMFKKLIGEPKKNSPFVVSEIGEAMDIEIDDSVFDIYTNPNKMEQGDAEALSESLDGFFNQSWYASDEAPAPAAKAKRCEPESIAPIAFPSGAENAIADEREDYALFDALQKVGTDLIALLFIRQHGRGEYDELIAEDKPLSKTRNKMIDLLVRDNDAVTLAEIAEWGTNVEMHAVAKVLRAL